MFDLLEIRTIGDEVLKQKAKRIKKKDIPSRKELIKEMLEELRDKATGVGIAAPQVGFSEQIIIIEIPPDEKHPEVEMPATIIINPKITVLDKEKENMYEGCLSVGEGDIAAIVPRYKRIKVEYLNENGEEQILELEGFKARVVQHEVDHLKGIMFLERVKDLKSITTSENLKKLRKKQRALEKEKAKAAKQEEQN